MKRILVGLLLTLMTFGLPASAQATVRAASPAAAVTPATGYYFWDTVHEAGGLKEAVYFEVKGDRAQVTLLRRTCRGDRILYYEFSGKDKAKGQVPVRDGVVRKTQSFRLDGVKYTMSVRITFTKATKATGWVRLQGGTCTGTKRRFSPRYVAS